jgi:hypothetical protein
MEVSGTIGPCKTHIVDVVISIVFSTNVSSYGPFGTVAGIRFQTPPMRYGSIVGFFVRSMESINAIGCYVNSEGEPVERQVRIYKQLVLIIQLFFLIYAIFLTICCCVYLFPPRL